MNTHKPFRRYFIVRATLKIANDAAIGILKITANSRFLIKPYIAEQYMLRLRFKRNKHSAQVWCIWMEEINESEYSTYSTMGVFQDIKSGYHFVSNCGIHIYSEYIDPGGTISARNLVQSNISYFLTNYKIPV